MRVLLLSLLVPGYILVCWVWYLAVMHLKRQRAQLSSSVRVMGQIVLGIGLVLDLVLTLVIGTIVFLDPPRETSATARLSRYFGRDDWRGSIARWICSSLLDPFDPEAPHCRI